MPTLTAMKYSQDLQDAERLQYYAITGKSPPPIVDITPPPELPAWECQQPLIKGQPAAAWIGLEVIQRPDGGGWPMEPGTVEAKEGEPPESGWFRLITARHPQGMTTHVQEVYPPGFTGCPLPCCRLRSKPFTLQCPHEF